MDNNYPVSLRDDWLARRARVDAVRTLPCSFPEAQIQILDHLISNYSSAPEATNPARFPLRTNQFVDRRWIIVNHKLGKAAYTAVRTMEESTQRTTGILKRMAALNLQDSVKTPAGGAELGVAAPAAPTVQNASNPLKQAEPPIFLTTGQRRALLELDDALQSASKWRIYQKIEGVFDANAVLTATSVDWLCKQLERKPVDVAISMEFLLQSSGETAANRIFAAWIASIQDVTKKDLKSKLWRVLELPKWRGFLSEKFRELLGDASVMRLEAIRYLGQAGVLDDVGLLLDLLSLPAASDDLPGEREALVEALKRLSGLPQ